MSSLTILVRRIDSVKKHPNADKLDLVQVGGWQLVSGKDNWKEGDLCVYVPPDSIIPTELAERIGVEKYLSNGRVKVAKLREENSFGVAFPPEPDMIEGQDVSEFYGITKYEPPVKFSAGDSERHHPLLFQYTDIENARHYNRVFEPNEQVVYTEKLHGSLSRLGVIWDDELNDYKWVAGSKGLQRRQSEGSLYWFAYYNIPQLKELVESILSTFTNPAPKSIIFYGEVFGQGVQNFDYGLKGKAWRMFDIAIDGKFANFGFVIDAAKLYNIPLVPVLEIGEFSVEKLISHSKGKSVLGGNHVREGVVVKPVTERIDPKIGRVILKYVSDDYLNKQKEDYTDR